MLFRRDGRFAEMIQAEVAGRFEIKAGRLEGPVAELSGGWQTRVGTVLRGRTLGTRIVSGRPEVGDEVVWPTL